MSSSRRRSNFTIRSRAGRKRSSRPILPMCACTCAGQRSMISPNRQCAADYRVRRALSVAAASCQARRMGWRQGRNEGHLRSQHHRRRRQENARAAERGISIRELTEETNEVFEADAKASSRAPSPRGPACACPGRRWPPRSSGSRQARREDEPHHLRQPQRLRPAQRDARARRVDDDRRLRRRRDRQRYRPGRRLTRRGRLLGCRFSPKKRPAGREKPGAGEEDEAAEGEAAGTAGLGKGEAAAVGGGGFWAAARVRGCRRSTPSVPRSTAKRPKARKAPSPDRGRPRLATIPPAWEGLGDLRSAVDCSSEQRRVADIWKQDGYEVFLRPLDRTAPDPRGGYDVGDPEAGCRARSWVVTSAAPRQSSHSPHDPRS